MNREELTIRWHNKPIDKLSSEEMRRALVEVLDHTMRPNQTETPPATFYPAFVTGMFVGGFFCFLAVAVLSGFGG